MDVGFDGPFRPLHGLGYLSIREPDDMSENDGISLGSRQAGKQS